MNVPPDAALLVKNLRFLNLDLQADWPNVTVETFRAGRNAQVTQKERVKCAEFILYKLFELYDYPTAKFKLGPFYPALEPRQSIKLRGVLFQLLSQLKSDGVLPRECTLRKTMLDDCLGERFEELLFFLSSFILRRILDAQVGGRSTETSYKLGTATWFDTDELEAVQPLTLTLSTSLRDSLVQRQQRRSRVAGLATTLRMKDSMMKARQSKAENTLTSSSAKLASLDIDVETKKRQIRDEHNGDEDWLEIGLSGDVEQGRDLLIEEKFENLWLPTIADTGLPPDTSSKGLLADLESRVQAQKTRLQSWKAFQVEVSRRNEDFVVSSPMKSPMRSPLNSPGKLQPLQHAFTPIRGSIRKVAMSTPVLAVPPHKSYRPQVSPQRRTPVPKPVSAADASNRRAYLDTLPPRAQRVDKRPKDQPSAEISETEVGNSSAFVLEAKESSRALLEQDPSTPTSTDNIDEAAPLRNRPHTPTEALFAEDADPSSVFKTRSKLRRTFSKSTYSTASHGDNIAQAL